MIWIGTSGYNYPEWKGSFYPADLPAAKMLPYYAARFPTVEINYTFYRMPNEKLVAGWAAQTPSPYKLTLKDLALFDAFLDELPPKSNAAFEFRHASWLDDEIFDRLAARHLALCVADSEKMSTPVRMTADYAYFRLRDEGYTLDDIKRWADTIARDTAGCREVFIYFKHEEEGKGPEFARPLMTHLGIVA
jgi:uncharacterized protein YecE (DUF72 family)